MERTDKHPFALRTNGLSNGGSPLVVGVVADFAPVNRDDGDRVAGALKNEAVGEQRIDNLLDR